MPPCPACDRLVTRNELFESSYECPFDDCDGSIPGRTTYPTFGPKPEPASRGDDTDGAGDRRSAIEADQD